jgi:hypothetical protein
MDSEIRPDRNVQDVIEVGAAVTGTVDLELSVDEYVDFLAGALCRATPAAVTVGGRDGNRYVNGTDRLSFSIEKMYLPGTVMRFVGMEVDQLQLTFQAQQVVKGQFTFTGKVGAVDTASLATGGYGAATTGKILNATTNVGALQRNGSAFSTGIQQIQLTLKNNLRGLPAIGYKANYDIGMGRFECTVRVNAYLNGPQQLQDYLNHSPFGLSWTVEDADARLLQFTIPRLYISQGSPKITGINTDVMNEFDAMAAFDSGIGGTLAIDVVDPAP